MQSGVPLVGASLFFFLGGGLLAARGFSLPLRIFFLAAARGFFLAAARQRNEEKELPLRGKRN